jgi:SAM-dependent methyltransferase
VAPESEGSMRSERTVPDFYDAIAPHYDEMTVFDQRFAKESPAFRQLTERFGLKTALDAGCGSGFHAVLLAQLGVRVTALDCSGEMVRLTEANARRYNVGVRTVQGSFSDIGSLLDERFDAVFVMGNSFPHLLTLSDLRQSLSALVKPITGGGLLVTQTLNYARILSKKDSVLSSRVSGGKAFVRSYEYDGDQILFSILVRKKGASGSGEERETVRLRPVFREELETLLLQLGMEDVRAFGTMMLEPFDPQTSTDLILMANKPRTG